MGFRITTNVASINAQRNLSNSQANMQNSYAQLASGSRINKSADDAAGLALSENLKAQIRSARMANRNANDGISMVQVAEGGLNEISNIITRLRELGIQAASDTVGDRERQMLNQEVLQLKDEMQRIALTTKWGDTHLLDGTAPVFDYQVGLHNNEFEDRISFRAGENNATIDELGLAGIDYAAKEGAQDALALLDEASLRVNSTRANLGALQSRLQSTTQNLSIQEENLSAANSRIRDTDVAFSSSESIRNNVLLQASTAALAQANQTPGLALKLIG
ncbi:MAG: flagellin FliC [Oligoflexia bacterium]|nr:flagellin FliC [Oligoflexia bacterium]